MEKLTRRSLLQSAPTAGLAALNPAAAVAAPQPSPIMDMFREWQAKYEQACAPTLPYSEVAAFLMNAGSLKGGCSPSRLLAPGTLPPSCSP